MAEQTLSQLFTNTGTFGLPKIELDVQNEIRSGSSAKDVAAYLSDNSGLNYDALTEDFNDDQIIMGLAQKDGKPYTDPSAFKVLAESSIESFFEGAAAFEGGKMGFQIGMKTPTVIGKAIATPVLTIGGALAGVEFADNISELFGFEDNLVPSKMPYRVAGETFGSGVAFMQAPFRAGLLVQPGTINWMKQNAKDVGTRLSTPFLEQVGYTALTRPGLTLSLEGASTVGSAAFGGFAELAKPGDEFNRLQAEVLGGFAIPGIFQLGPTITSGAKNFINSFREKGRMEYAGGRLVKLLEEAGEDPKDIINAINRAQDLGIDDVSTAALTGSEAFKSLNKTLFKDYPGLKPELKAQLQRNLDGAEKLIQALISTKDPTAITSAAKIRDQLFKTKVTLRLAQARMLAEEKITKLTPGLETSEKAGLEIQNLLKQALKDVRDEESRLYNLIPGQATFSIDTTRKTLLELLDPKNKDGLLPGEINELGLKTSGIQLLNRIIGDVKTDDLTFANQFINQSDQLQSSFFRLIGYAPTKIQGIKPSVSNRWSIDKSLIEDEYGLEKGSLKNITIEDLKNGNFDKLKSAQYSQEVIDNSAEEGITLGLFGDNRKDVEDLFSDLTTKHLKTLRETASNLSFRGSSNDKSLAKLIDASIKDFRKNLPEDGTEAVIDTSKLTLNEIRNLRTQIFSTASKQATAGDIRNAHFLNKIANAINDDIGLRAEQGTDEITNLIKQAHGFSLALNDTFTRGFPNTLLKKNKDGRLAVIPELSVNSILGGGGDAVAYNFSGIEAAVSFLQKQTGQPLDEELTKKLGTLSGAEEDILHIAFSKIINFDTKKVDPEKLARFLSPAGNGKILERFPAIKKDLSDILTAQKLYDSRKALYGEVLEGGFLKTGNLAELKKLKNIFTFADLLPADTNPGLVIGNAIGTPEQRPGNPVVNLKRIIAFGKKAKNPDVLEGIKEVIFDRALQYSMDSQGNMNFSAFKNYLYKPLAKGQPSAIEVLRNQGVLKSDEAVRFNTLINRMITAQKSIPSDTTVPVQGDLVSGVKAFGDLLARLIGSKIGTSLSGMIPGRGSGIIEGAAGVRTVLGGLNIPTSLTQDLFLQAAKDPQFAKLLLQQPKSEKEALVLARRLRTFILNSGLGFISRTTEAEDQDEGRPSVPRQFDPEFLPGITGSIEERSSVQPNQEGSPTTQIGQGLNSGVNNRLAANVGTPPPAASIDRNKFASLFPNDPISGLINAQQQPTQFMQYGGMAGDPSFDMGLETDVTAQQAIQSALEDTGSDDNIPRPGVRLPSTLKRAQGRRPTGILQINNPLLRQAYDFILGKSAIKPSLSMPEGGGIQFGLTKTFQDGGFVDAGGGGDEDDYISDAYSQSDFNQFDSQDNIDFGNYADETSAMQAAQGIVNLAGQERSNIRDSVNYDPIYAQALNITRGLLPGNQGQSIENLTRPPSLTPQIPGDLDMRAGYGYERPMFFSGLEKFAVQDAPGLVRQAMDMGIMGLVRKAGDYFSGNFSKLFGGGEEVTPQKIKMEDLTYTNPIQTKGITQIPLNEYLFTRSGMKPRTIFDLTDPGFEIKDFQPGGAYDQRENFRIEVLPDGRQVVRSLGNV